MTRRALLVGALLLASCAGGGVRFDEAPLQRGAVVSEHPLATQVGLDVLARGGNAADAAVATALALAVVYPVAGNLGGGGFALWAGADGAEEALDFRETAPTSADAAAYLDEEGRFVPARSLVGPLAVGVPGSPLGLHELWRRHGSGAFTWAELVQPALRLAREGFAVDPWLADDLTDEEVRAKMNPTALALFYPGGAPLEVGDRLVQPVLAGTLARLAAEGPRGFYGGPVAEALVGELARSEVPGLGRATRGFCTLEDLAGYAIAVREPLVGQFQGHELFAMPPPSSGGLVILQVLGVLEGLPLSSEVEAAREAGWRDALGERMVHWWIEALRMAFADRAEHMGDPDFHDVPVRELLSPAWITARRTSISERARVDVAPWAPPHESAQTTHLSVLDRAGNAVSMTTTLNGAFGSGLMVRGGGFLLNNELDDFAIQAGVPNQFGLVGNEANALRPRKRPLSSMSPTIARDTGGRVCLVIGSPGGPRIITATLQVMLRVWVLGQELGDAVRSPRLHQQWSPQATRFEAHEDGGWPPALLEALRERGQPLELLDWGFGSVQAILVEPDGSVRAASDPRRGGAAGLEGLGVTAPALPPRD
ncbi:MAG: gamma-glutamyltransferase [Planctomycetes bacterium]|nr:gamma-glutamyltransferase [Planctomycetota bacterium]